jgi:glycerophosphodiester phosphodiesterase
VNLDKSRSPLLALAIESGHIEVAETLIELGWGLDFLGCQGQSPLYKAARRGHDGLVKLLLQASVDGNTTDTISQWTPLIVASVYGFTDSVKHLKAAGVDASRLDRRGWSAVDHASYRGYPKVVEALKSTGTWASVAEPLGTVSLQYPDANAPPTVTLDKHTRDLQSGVDTETSHIFVNLGSLDLYRTCKGIDMQPYLDKISPEKLPESDMLLEVEASGCKEKYRIHLPIMEDLTNSPWQFSTKTPDTVRLSFRLLKSICRDEHDNAVLCSALALLKSLRQGLGQGREMVSRDHTVPLVDGSGTYAGDLNFNFLVCHPFKPDSEVPIPQQMRRLEPTRVGGHRGMLLHLLPHLPLTVWTVLTCC